MLAALAWIRSEHPQVDAVHLMGDSAGGNLVLMLGILLANPEQLAALPPTFITVGSKDQLAESSRLCAEYLRKRFDAVEYEVYPGEAHGFFNRSGRPACRKLRADMLAFLAQQ